MLRRRRERRDADPTREPVAIELPAAVFDGQLVDPVLDDARLAQVEPALRDAWAQTAGYAQGIDPVEVTDRAALVRIDQLRVALEAALGQRITFRGERRESSGVRIILRIDELWGSARTVDVGVLKGDLVIDETIGRATGDIVVVRADRIEN